MYFEWDPVKAAGNLAKHGIRFADAVALFADEWALTIADDTVHEERFVTVGIDGFGRVLVVVYTFRGDVIRLISARPATRRERQQYEGKS